MDSWETRTDSEKRIVIDIEDIRANVKNAVRPTKTQSKGSFVSNIVSERRPVCIEEFEGKFAYIPVNTAIWCRYRGFFDRLFKRSHNKDTSEIADITDLNIESEVKGIRLYTKSGVPASFELSMIKLTEPTTLEKYIQQMKCCNTSGSPYSRGKVQNKGNKLKRPKIGFLRGAELNFSRRSDNKWEAVTDIFALLGEKTIIKARYCTKIGQSKLYSWDVKRMLRNIRFKSYKR